MTNQELIQQTADFVKKTQQKAESGHDWWHIYRVWQLAKHIAQTEKVKHLVVELGALLHDIADAKFHNGDDTVGPAQTRDFLESLSVKTEIIEHVVKIVENISFKGGNHEQKFKSPELDVVQDADRLDALGAIGIARAFSYGGYKQRPMYDPRVKPQLNQTKEQYYNQENPTINHFYEKLLLLKDRMNTDTGRKLAAHRHKVLEDYLNEFYLEWEGKR